MKGVIAVNMLDMITVTGFADTIFGSGYQVGKRNDFSKASQSCGLP